MPRRYRGAGLAVATAGVPAPSGDDRAGKRDDCRGSVQDFKEHLQTAVAQPARGRSGGLGVKNEVWRNGAVGSVPLPLKRQRGGVSLAAGVGATAPFTLDTEKGLQPSTQWDRPLRIREVVYPYAEKGGQHLPNGVLPRLYKQRRQYTQCGNVPSPLPMPGVSDATGWQGCGVAGFYKQRARHTRHIGRPGVLYQCRGWVTRA